MTIIYRAVKGSDLTANEVDGNFHDLDDRVTVVEGSFANPIDSISIASNVLTIHYTTAAGGGSDSVVIPASGWNFTGAWQPGIQYFAMDVFSFGSRLYLVLIDHTSDSTFDPGKQVSLQNCYETLLAATGETTTSILDAGIYTLTPIDSLTYFRCVSTAGCTVTVPSTSEADLPINSEVSFRQCADSVIFEASTAVTLNIPDGRYSHTDHVGAVVTLKKVDTDEWDAFGSLAAVTA